MVTVVQPLFTKAETDALVRILEYLGDEQKSFRELPPQERSEHIFQSVLTLRGSGMIPWERFALGKFCCTPGAIEALERAKQQPWEFLTRHSSGDWGEVCSDDWQENTLSLEQGFRLLSSYRTTLGEKLWVITEADRSVTTILLPEEY